MDTRGSVTKYFYMRRMCMSYKLEIKQLLKFRHCRIYRSFIRELMRDKNLKTKGNSYLFFYVILCSYANFRISYIQIESNYFTVYPGHWVWDWGRCRSGFVWRTRNRLWQYWIAVFLHPILQPHTYICGCKWGAKGMILLAGNSKDSVLWNNESLFIFFYSYPVLQSGAEQRFWLPSDLDNLHD